MPPPLRSPKGFGQARPPRCAWRQRTRPLPRARTAPAWAAKTPPTAETSGNWESSKRKLLQGLGQSLHRHERYFPRLELTGTSLGQDNLVKAHLLRFAEAQFDLTYSPNLAREPNLAQYQRVRVEGAISQRRNQRCADGKIRVGVRQLHAAGHVDEDVASGELYVLLALQHRSQQRDPVAIHAHRGTARGAVTGGRHQCLDFDQNGTRSVKRRSHYRSGFAERALGQKERGWIRDLHQAASLHLEHANFIGRAEAVLVSPEDAERMSPISLEVQNSVDHVLQNPWSRNCAFFGHVPDQEGGDTRLLRERHQPPGDFSHLSDRSRSAAKVGQIHRLNRVNCEGARLQRFSRRQNLLRVRFRE